MTQRRRRVSVLHGPNLGALGTREPALYGSVTLRQLHRRLAEAGRALRLQVACRQTDAEGEFVRWVHAAGRSAEGLIINPGAWTHTSVAVRDAVAALRIPVIEVHCSNIFARETFRRHSFVAPIVHGMIVGFGIEGYLLALRALGTVFTSDGPHERDAR